MFNLKLRFFQRKTISIENEGTIKMLKYKSTVELKGQNPEKKNIGEKLHS